MASDRPGEAGNPARRLWAAVERIHAVIYFAPEVPEALAAAGLPGFWRGYFGARAAPLGAVGPEVVTAVLFGFAPSMVARAVPDVWERCPPARVLRARLAGVTAALDRIAAGVPGDDVTAAAELAAAAVERLDIAGRPLAAANRSLPLEGTSWARLWQACTTLREHRGDGHVAACVAAGLGGLDAHAVQVASGAVPRSKLQAARGWTDDEWGTAIADLVDRGLLAADDGLTAVGRRLKDGIEATTDELALAPFAGWEAEVDLLTDRCAGIAAAIDASDTVPYPNPIGLPR